MAIWHNAMKTPLTMLFCRTESCAMLKGDSALSKAIFTPLRKSFDPPVKFVENTAKSPLWRLAKSLTNVHL